MLTTFRRSESGFLLIESLMATVLLGVAFAAFAGLTSMLVKQDAKITSQAYLSAQGRAGIDQLANELQSAMCNNTTQPVTAATATQLQFTTPDRQQPFHLLQLTYNLSGGVFTRSFATSTNTSTSGPPWTMGAASGAATVVDNVTSSSVFTYYDSLGSPLASPVTGANLQKIARVVMTLTVVPTGSSGSGGLVVQGSATIRVWTTQQQCV